MENWDDYRLLLAVQQSNSIRAAGERFCRRRLQKEGPRELLVWQRPPRRGGAAQGHAAGEDGQRAYDSDAGRTV